MKSKIKDRAIWFGGTAGALFICFLLCRYFAFELFGNRQWAVVMFIIGLSVIFIAACFGGKKVMLCTDTGYVISFLAGIIFNFEYELIADGTVQDHPNTWWQIWTIVFLCIIVAGIVWEIFSNIITKRKTGR